MKPKTLILLTVLVYSVLIGNRLYGWYVEWRDKNAPEPVLEASTGVWENYPLLKRICSCESWGDPNKEPRQNGNSGGVLRGYPNPNDVGACQINLPTWKRVAEQLKLDVVNNFNDNVKMAKWIYDKDKRHEKNWNASKSCWKQ